MSLAAEARDRARAHPFLLHALRAGVVNYRAAAAYLDLDGDPDAVATALRRYADELDPLVVERYDATVRLQSGVGLAGTDEVETDDHENDDVVLTVGAQHIVRGGSMTALRVTGDVDSRALQAVLARLRTTSVLVDAAGIVGDELVVVVPRRQGATALQLVEESLAAVPV